MDEEVKTGQVVSQADRDRAALLQVLTDLGSAAVGDESVEFAGTKIVLPAALKGPGWGEKARKQIRDIEAAQEKSFDIRRVFPFRPFDGAAAFHRAMMRLFGTAGLGKSTWSFFGENRPELLTVDVGWGETMQVPWGTFELAMLDCVFEIEGTLDRERGPLSLITATVPKKNQAIIEGFFAVVEDELQQRSIYRGKAINGAGDPGFFNHQAVDASKVIYSTEIITQLNANVWSVIDHAQAMRDNDIPLKRAFLLEGTYGTGKTQAGAITAQHAVKAGWTFILVRPEDDPLQAIRTAQLYSPAVVWVEDVDNLASQGRSRTQISAVLDAMDGIAAKNTDVMVGFTTNFASKIDKGMLRPGRIDAVISLGALDRTATEQLVKVTVDPALLEKIDYDRVFAAFTGFVPAYAVEASQRAVRYSIARNQGRPSVITTDDLVQAADGMRAQLKLMTDAPEVEDVHTIERAITTQVEGVLLRANLGGHPFSIKGKDE